MKKYFKVTVNFIGEPESKFFADFESALEMFNSCERGEIEEYEGYLSADEEEYLLESSANEEWLIDEGCLERIGYVKSYCVVERQSDFSGDSFTKAFDYYEEALKHAEYIFFPSNQFRKRGYHY